MDEKTTKCPRCVDKGMKHCALCGEHMWVTPELAAAYRLLVDPDDLHPYPEEVIQLRKDLGDVR